MRSFSLVLLRRLLFRSPTNQTLPLYDHLSAATLSNIERLLLHSLLREPSVAVRRRATDTIAELANYSMSRGRPWHALQQQAFSMADSEDAVSRENAFRVFAGSPNLIIDLQTESVIAVLQKGLQDPQSVDVSTLSTARCYHDHLDHLCMRSLRDSSVALQTFGRPAVVTALPERLRMILVYRDDERCDIAAMEV